MSSINPNNNEAPSTSFLSPVLSALLWVYLMPYMVWFGVLIIVVSAKQLKRQRNLHPQKDIDEILAKTVHWVRVWIDMTSEKRAGALKAFLLWILILLLIFGWR
jgi:uncharacterized BrkB/YihY/UPF0761 family membrane protein